jgi:hypothetical protein
MSLSKFAIAFDERFKTMPIEYRTFIDEYLENEKKQYDANKQNGKITFGKYKGYSVKELALTDKGKDYLQWLMAQTFFTEDKFPDLHKELKDLKIKKKKTKLAPLE